MGCTDKAQETKNLPVYTKQQTDIMGSLGDTYSPYVGKGALGGLSDLETNSLNMLKSADVWGPLTSAGTGLLTGTSGAQKISPQMAANTFQQNVENPARYAWEDKLKPGIKEEYSGPGYWGSARADAVSEGAGNLERGLSSERANWMWDAENVNRSIDEAKAGRSLSAISAYPASALNWASGLAGIGSALQSKLNAITDPQVLAVLQTLLGVDPAGSISKTTSPFNVQDWMNIGGQAAGMAAGLPPMGGGGVNISGSSFSNPMAVYGAP
ncbi:MAG: hypothetical protein IMZ71_01095 [Chloroflexi bacterium]|nr:hypothetical protein [Chloroflexota bacterium]